MEDRKLDQLIINKLTAEQHQKLIENNEIAEDEIYLVPSIEEELQADVESLKEQQSSVNTNLSEINQKIQNNTIKIEENSTAISMNAQKIGENTAAIEENASQISQYKEEVNGKISLVEQSLAAQNSEIETVKGDLTSYTNSSNAQFSAVREEFSAQDTETLKTAKEYSDANKESAVSSAKGYTDQKIDELVNGTGLEGVVDTIKDINEAMAESSDMLEALETANSKKVDKGAKGSIIKPIYFDENGAQEIAYTIEKSVPADAKFTDTTYTLIKDATNHKIHLMNGTISVSEVDDNNTTYTIDGSLSASSTNPIQNKVVAENINSLQEDIDANASEIEEINSKDLFETKHEEGNAIAVSDSAEASFAGMKLFGKTTQNGTPTPDAPVPLVSVGDSGSFEVGVYGGNLLDVAEEITVTTAYIFKNYPVFLKANTPYTISLISSQGMPGDFVFTYVNENNEGKQITSFTGVSSNQRYSYTFTLPENAKSLSLYCNRTDCVIKQCMLNVGTSALPYEPYKAKQSITFTDTLRSVGDIKDEVDFARGVKIQRTVKLTDFVKSAEFTNTDKYSLRSSYNLIGNETKSAICNVTDVYAFTELDNVHFFIYEPNNAVVVYLPKGYDIVSNPIEVIATLKEPIETPLTEEELNTYRQLHTNKPNTTILSEADMELDYVVDSTSAEYIENRLEEVKDKIPTKTSQLTNDSSFVNQTGLDNALEDKLSFDEEIINSESSVSKIVPEGSGKYAVINKVGGMSYKSRNLLEVNNTTQTVGGVTFTNNGDGSLTIKGTATREIPFALNVKSKIKLPKGQYICSGDLVLYTYKNGEYAGTFCNQFFDLANYDEEIFPHFYCSTGKTYDTTIKPMIIKADETNTSYEPYYSGLRNAYVTGIKSVGKNLADYSKFKQQNYATDTSITINDNVVTFYANANGFYLDDLVMRKGVTYLITGNVTNIVNFRVFRKGDWLNAVGFVTYNPTTGAIGCRYTPTYDDEVIRIWVSGQTAVLTDFMISVADVSDLTYSPYKESTFTIPTGARGVGYGMGVNENVYNYIDFERGVYVQNCVKITGFSQGNTQTNTKYFYKKDNPHLMGLDNGGNYTICSHIDNYAFNTADNPHYYIHDTSIGIYLPISVDDSVANEIEVIATLATPIETDISDYIQDNFIEVAEGGVITAVNEYGYDVPTEYEFYTSENPEKVIVANKVVGDLVGVAEEAQSLTGLDSTTEELNLLHKEAVTKNGWLIPEKGITTMESLCGAPGVIGLKIGNTYTVTATYKDGTTETEDIVAIDSSDRDYDAGAVIVQCGFNEGIVIIDKAGIDSEFNITVGTNHYWYPPSVVDEEIVSILVTGIKSDDTTLTHVEENYKKLPEGLFPDNVFGDPPIKQYWEWTANDTNSPETDLGFEKPEGYNRCRILIYERQVTSGGALGITMPVILPLATKRGSDAVWSDVEMAGRTLADVELGNGEGENQTWGGTEWISTVSIDVYFTDKGYICNYVCGTDPLSGKTVSAGSGYPETYAGQLSGVLSEDADVDSILDFSLVWTLGIFLYRNKGNYVEVTWYKD